METVAEYTGLNVPDYALFYLVNGDDSGIEPDDKAIVDAWYAEFEQKANAVNGHVIFSTETDDEGYFSNSPEFGLPCTCYDCTIIIVR